MPWQQSVADVVCEIDPVTGRLYYQEFGLTVPRQSGKSTFILAKAIHRCSATGFFGDRQRLVYTAQTRQKAREKWDEDFASELEHSAAFKNRVHAHRGPGNEHLRFANGSRFGIEANTEKAGHGGTLDEAYIDEAFAQVDYRLEQAFGPAMITRPNKQLGWVSTAGWVDGSAYLSEKVDLGRRLVLDGSPTRIAFFDWSAPEDCDPGDPRVWWGCMPALGFTIHVDDIRMEYDKALRADKMNEFKRAYLNVWVPKSVGMGNVFAPGVWDAQRDPRSQIAGRVSLAVEVAQDRSWSVVAASGARADGALHVQIAENHRGTEWVVGKVAELASGGRVTVAPNSPAGSLIEDLESRGLTVDKIPTGEYAQACGAFFDRIHQRGIYHLGQPELDVAVSAARKKTFSDAWVFDRRNTSLDISPLAAVTLAAWTASIEQPSVYEDRGVRFL